MIAIAAMASCTTTSEDEFDPNAPVEINFGASIQSLSRAALSTGSAFNAYVVRQDVEEATKPTFIDLKPISANVDTDGKVNIATQYYDATNKKSYFIGFTADKTTAANTGAATATVEYTGIDGQTDIMATDTIPAGKKSATKPVALAYKHLLSQLQFKFVAGTNFPTGVKVSSLKINKVKNAATLTLGDTPALAFTGDATNVYTVITNGTYEITTVGTPATETVLVEAGLPSFEIEIVAGGITYTSTITVTDGTLASSAHLITLTFLPSNVSFGNATIGEWKTGSTGSGNVQ